MAEVMTLAYLAGGVLVVVAAYLLIRFLRPTHQRGRSRRWVDRSERDRRQRTGYLRPERRKQQRRDEDVARRFLDRMGD